MNNIVLRKLMKDLKKNISYDKPYIIDYHEYKYEFKIASGFGYDLMKIEINHKDNTYKTSLAIQPSVKKMSNELLAYEVEEALHLMVQSIENGIISCLCSYTYYLDPRNLEWDKQIKEKYKESQIQWGLKNATKEQLEQALKERENKNDNSLYDDVKSKLMSMLNNDKLEGIEIKEVSTKETSIEIIFTQYGANYQLRYYQKNALDMYEFSKSFGFDVTFESLDELSKMLLIINNYEKECCALANSVSEEKYLEDVKLIRKKFNKILKEKVFSK